MTAQERERKNVWTHMLAFANAEVERALRFGQLQEDEQREREAANQRRLEKPAWR